MFQLHHNYTDTDSLRTFVGEVRKALDVTPHGKALFRLLTDTSNRELTTQATDVIRESIPDAMYFGCSTGGNIFDGRFVQGPSGNLTIGCDIFEDADTTFEVVQLPLGEERTAHTTQTLLDIIAERPWIRSIGMLATIDDARMEIFCDAISAMREDIVFYGAGAITAEEIDVYNGLPYVFSSAGDPSGHAAVFTLYGGENLHVSTQAIVGWKPLGLPLEITRAKGPVVYELDGQPAYERYYHYLQIEDDERFAENSLVFPLAIDEGGTSVIKAPLKTNEDGSLVLTSEVSSWQKSCRLAYGDPATILESIEESAHAMSEFDPQAIVAYSCAGRLMYWGPEYISSETVPFNDIAPTVGFYSGSEFMRHGKRVLHHNMTLVIVGMREGDASSCENAPTSLNKSEFSRQMAIVKSLTALVGATSLELGEAYAKMESMAKIDGLTGIANRREIEAFVESSLEEQGSTAANERSISVIMLDLDNFKIANDAYGHKAGDDVLKRFGELLRKRIDETGLGMSGRWGGEEFMAVLPSCTLAQASPLAQELCDTFAGIEFPLSGRHTVSIGVAQALPGESPDLLCQRVDKALYAAKKQGKNCVVTA